CPCCHNFVANGCDCCTNNAHSISNLAAETGHIPYQYPAPLTQERLSRKRKKQIGDPPLFHSVNHDTRGKRGSKTKAINDVGTESKTATRSVGSLSTSTRAQVAYHQATSKSLE
ncbi:hypothetical protein BGZ65_006320, partial [Modicella reniformis]